MTLVPFSCPTCKHTIYASPNAEVGHVCKNKRGVSRKLTLFVRHPQEQVA